MKSTGLGKIESPALEGAHKVLWVPDPGENKSNDPRGYILSPAIVWGQHLASVVEKVHPTGIHGH